MEKQIDLAATNICKNRAESYGEVCVRCNECGRFNKERAEEIIYRIYKADILHETYHRPEKPVVFMSRDILAVLTAELPDRAIVLAYAIDIEICGYKVKLADGIGVLYIGFEI